MKKRFFAGLTVIALGILAGHGAYAATTNRCDTWTRRDTPPTPTAHPGDKNLDQTVDTPEDLYVMDGADSQGRDARYGAKGKHFYVKALGGGGYGSHFPGYPGDDPYSKSGEGGVVEGDVNVSDLVPGAPDVNFSVSSFSAANENDNAHNYDTAQSACVSVGGNKVSTGALCPVWTTPGNGFLCDPNTGETYIPTHSVPHP